MNPERPLTHVDEHLFAALLSGTLGEREREQVLARLAADPDARIVLQMAMEALEAAESASLEQEDNAGSKRRAA